jgi:hypothetical protein
MAMVRKGTGAAGCWLTVPKPRSPRGSVIQRRKAMVRAEADNRWSIRELMSTLGESKIRFVDLHSRFRLRSRRGPPEARERGQAIQTTSTGRMLA